MKIIKLTILIFISIFLHSCDKETIIITEIDPLFETYLVKNKIDSDGIINGIISDTDLGKIKVLEFTDKDSFRTIPVEKMKQLEVLKVYNLTEIQSMDFTNCLALKTLRIEHCENLNRVILSENINLSFLDIWYCKNLSQLEMGNNINLHLLQLASLKITKLNTSLMKNLEIIGLSNLPITELDLTQNVNLWSIDIYGASSTFKVNVAPNMPLKYLYFNSASHLLIDYRNFPNLESLSIWKTNLSKFDISMLKKLNRLDLQDNQIESIDISKNPELKEIDLSNNKLKSLNVSKNLKIVKLNTTYNSTLSNICVNVSQLNTIYWVKDATTTLKICD